MATADNVWFRGVSLGTVVEVRTSTPDLTLRQLRHLLKVLHMVEGFIFEDMMRDGPEDSCIGRDELP